MATDFAQSSEQFLASLDAEIERLQDMRQQIAAVLGTEAPAKVVEAPKRRSMSAEGRRRIAEAQKARWAKQKDAAEAPAKRVSARKGVAKQAKPKKAAAKKSAAKKAAAKKSATA